MVRRTSAGLPHRSTEVLVDVTSIIGAEDFIKAQNHGRQPLDPFARQAFVEMIQSLIFMERVWIAHPVLPSPAIGDFGAKPFLLQVLTEAELLHPLRLDERQMVAVRAAESRAIQDLQSMQGNRSLAQFIEQAHECDGAARTARNSLARRIHGWCEFQASQVRVAGHHADRITTADGIEDDQFGQWARAASIVLRGSLRSMGPEGEEPYIASTLVRGLKYRCRAEAADLSYQAHPMRRDFLLTFELTREGADDEVVLDVIKLVRGLHESLAAAARDNETHRMQLLELELPLLGGRLWKPGEAGRLPDERWIRFVVSRIADYRAKSSDLRAAVARCVADEDFLRLARDIDSVRRQLLERLGLRQVTLSPVERSLVDGVASVAESFPGVPKVTGLWLGARSMGKHVRPAGTPVQRFLYKEFVQAWKRAGR